MGRRQYQGSEQHFPLLGQALRRAERRYGIDGGRISKLMLKRDGKITYSYDRGLDIAPTDKATETTLAILMKEYN